MAVKMLYGGPTEQQGAAASWLSAVTHSPQAWHIAWALLGEQGAVEVQFFAANMLLTKVRHDWKRLAPAERTSLIDSVRCVAGHPHVALILQHNLRCNRLPSTMQDEIAQQRQRQQRAICGGAAAEPCAGRHVSAAWRRDRRRPHRRRRAAS